jgi:hypothetical protein
MRNGERRMWIAGFLALFVLLKIRELDAARIFFGIAPTLTWFDLP